MSKTSPIRLFLSSILLFFLASCSSVGSIPQTNPSSKAHVAEETSPVFYGYNSSNDALNSYVVQSSQLHVRQSYPLGSASYGRTVVLSADTMYVATGKGMSATRLSDGKMLWNAPLNNRVAIAPIVEKETLYVITSADTGFLLFAFGTKNGSLRWRQSFALQFQDTITGFQHSDDDLSSALIRNDILYLGTAYGAAAFDLSTQKILWYHAEEGAFRFDKLLLQPDALSLLMSGKQDTIYVLNPRTGKTLWAYDTVGVSKQDFGDAFQLVITDDGDIYGYNKHVVRAFNRLTGRTLWEVPHQPFTQNNAVNNIVVGDETLYFKAGPGGGDILALSRKDGSQVWAEQSTDAYQMLAVGQGQVYALGQQTLYAFDAQTGKAVWKQAVGAAILYPGIDAHTKSLYLVDESSLRQPTATTSLVVSLDPTTGKTLWSANQMQIIRSTLP